MRLKCRTGLQGTSSCLSGRTAVGCPLERRKSEFQKLHDDEVVLIEKIVNDAFSGSSKPSLASPSST
jgi:hypothetical protein